MSHHQSRGRKRKFFPESRQLGRNTVPIRHFDRKHFFRKTAIAHLKSDRIFGIGPSGKNRGEKDVLGLVYRKKANQGRIIPRRRACDRIGIPGPSRSLDNTFEDIVIILRSEERRVGKEWRCRGTWESKQKA